VVKSGKGKGKGKGRVVPVRNQAPRYEDVWGSWIIAPRILNHRTRCRLMGSLTTCVFTPGDGAPVTYWIGAGWAPEPV
jgi:hypothetical protein